MRMEVIKLTIKERRRELGLTQRELAERMGVDQSSVANWETGATGPHRNKLVRLAKVLGCSVEELLDDDGNK